MKKMMVVSAFCLFASCALADGDPAVVAKLVESVPPQKIVEIGQVFKETGARYAADYQKFLAEYLMSEDKLAVVKRYLPKLEKACEEAKAEVVADDLAERKSALLAEIANYVKLLKDALSSPEAPADVPAAK